MIVNCLMFFRTHYIGERGESFDSSNQWGSNSDNPTLLFVYNADSGVISSLKDYLHKIASPSSYPCRLCAVTYGNLGMKKEWKTFIEKLDFHVEFLHRDELRRQHRLTGEEFPAVFVKRGEDVSLLVSNVEINSVQSLHELMNLVIEKIRGLDAGSSLI